MPPEDNNLSLDSSDEVFRTLDLVLPDPAADPVDEAGRQLVARELASASALVGPLQGPNRPAQLYRVYEIAASRLVQQGRHDLTIWLAARVEPVQEIRGTLARLRLVALQKTGDLDALFAEMARLDTPSTPPPLRDQITQFRIVNSDRLSVYDVLSEIGAIPATAKDLLVHLNARADELYVNPRLSQLVHGMRGAIEPYDDLHRRMAWGYRAGQCMKLVANAAQTFLRQSRKSGFLTADQDRLIGLHSDLATLARPVGIERLRAVYESGQSILFATAHAGLMLMTGNPLMALEAPVTLIRAGAIRTEASGRILHLATGENLQLEFARLVKRLHREQHIVHIFPDGLGGTDQLQFELLGRRIALRQGAATLAHHGSMATFFCRSVWTGDSVELHLIEGPKTDRTMDRSEWDRLWYDFYLGCLRDIVQGAPEDMGGEGGFWASLLMEN
jgi:hypothetical protein